MDTRLPMSSRSFEAFQASTRSGPYEYFPTCPSFAKSKTFTGCTPLPRNLFLNLIRNSSRDTCGNRPGRLTRLCHNLEIRAPKCSTFSVMAVRTPVLPEGQATLNIPFQKGGEGVFLSWPQAPVKCFSYSQRVHSISPVMSRTVGDEGDEFSVVLFGFAGLLGEGVEEQVDKVDVAQLIVPTDVVDGTRGTFAQDSVDGAAVVLDVQPVADIEAVAVD